jgi:Flp pilus assembly protein TadD
LASARIFTLLEPDQGVEIVRQAWPHIEVAEVKTGLLKTFAFSKSLPKKHPKLFLILDLGMKDDDPAIRKYAASYLADYADQDFSGDPKGYAKWFRTNGDKTPDEVLRQRKASNTDEGENVTSRPDRAAQADERLEQLNEESAAARKAPGWPEFFSGDYVAAERSFRRQLMKNPNDQAVMNGLGFSLLNQGQAIKAKPYFEKILARQPDALGPLNGLARCLKEEGQLDEAISVWERARGLDPSPNDISAGLAMAYVEKGEPTKSVPLLEEFVEANPENKRARALLEEAREASSIQDE